MRIELGVFLIELTYLVFNFSPQNMGSFSDFPRTKQYIVQRISRGLTGFLLPGPFKLTLYHLYDHLSRLDGSKSVK
jgi:hypothetical protein